ncbi:Tn7-like element transposition protein TnsE [Alteromonas sp. ASW11-130]|uniref:Tn7-like element transposition protein TnsE n=1 Tax=Alteromonas sp. ASW11-130 TaxID=3015775 RepID=UPI002241DEA6|nr:Tn7-like element transposition protein TnsE [Alteromonas sp. ASW11-130]MCW8093208.1 Tn7-like element transposition protein TnsE [Alteromonas sp. ASW11-130]
MAGTKYKIKGVEDNDTLLYIGSLFRNAYSADWHIQVRFKKSQKRSVLASLISDLVVGHTYNATGTESVEKKLKSLSWSKVIADLSGHGLGLNSLNIDNRFERYFVLEKKGSFVAIPQLELARALFLQNSKMFHYALEPLSLGIDFNSYQPNINCLYIEVNASAQLSRSRFTQIFNQGKLAYTLCDKAGNNAFLSIHENHLKYRKGKKYKDGNTTTWWSFAFNPPDLTGAKLKVVCGNTKRNYKNKPLVVVTEIVGLTDVPNSLPNNIRFLSKDWLKASAHKAKGESEKPDKTPSFFEIDDETSASSFLPERTVNAQGLSEFSLNPKRHSETLTTNKKIVVGVDGDQRELAGSELASTDLSSLLGEATPVVTSSNTDDQLDQSVFDAFKAMVEEVGRSPNLDFISYEIRTLHKVGASRSHNKKISGIPRCAAVAHFKTTSSLNSLTLIELDLTDFDDNKRLSTLLFHYDCLDEARGRVDPILSALVAKSLSWPRKYLEHTGIKAKFISHIPGHPVNNSVFSEEQTQSWARAILEKI